MKDAFNILSRDLQKIIREFGYEKPTEIQEKAIPEILSNPRGNFLLIAPTGAGKTEAAIFPIFDFLLNRGDRKEGILVLYITPLRALNRDVFRRLVEIGERIGLRIEIRHSDTPESMRSRQAKKPPHILITTPESLQSILCGKRIRNHLRSVEWVIIDELHALIDNKRGCQLALGLERLRELTKRDLSIIALSATIRNAMDALNFITGGRGGKIITSSEEDRSYSIKIDAVRSKLAPAPTIYGVGIRVNIDEIAKRIAEYVRKEKGKVLVFTNTRDMAEILGLYLKKYSDFPFAIHHSSLSRDLRVKIEREFKEGNIKCVIATSSLELGIDIGEIDLVIQIMSPRRVEVALQRIGRARHKIGKTARGVIIAATMDDLFESMAVVRLISQRVIEPLPIIDKSYDVLAHQVIGIVREKYLDTGVYPRENEIYEIVRRAFPFQNLSLEEFRWLLNFLEHRCNLIMRRKGRVILRRGALRYYFENLSTIPSVLKYDVIDIEEKKKIGEVDEKFVMEMDVGDKFLLAGIPREVLEISSDRKAIFVSPISTDAIPPRWTGELLPVSYEVAQEVGNIRRLLLAGKHGEIIKQIDLSFDAREWLKELKDIYPKEKPVLDRNSIVVEIDDYKGIVIIHAPFGTNINRTLAILLASILSENPNFPLTSFDSDAYRIQFFLYNVFYLREETLINALEEAFNTLIDYARDIDSFKRFLIETITELKLEDLRWYFVQVLKRFGLVRSEVYLPKQKVLRIMSEYVNTPVFAEAVHEYVFYNLDPERTRQVLLAIDQGQISVWFTRGLSPLGMALPIVPQMVIKDLENWVIRKYEERLLKKEVRFICLSCGYYEIRPAFRVLLICPHCGATRITVVKKNDTILMRILDKMRKKVSLSSEEVERLRIAEQISRFLRTYGELTAITVATTGIGLKQAIELLRKFADDRNLLLKELRKREANYYKTRIFWQK